MEQRNGALKSRVRRMGAAVCAGMAAVLVAAACSAPPASTATPAGTGTPSAGATGTPGAGGMRYPQMDAAVVQAYTRFGLGLFQQAVSQDAGKNVFISPSSAAFALGMTYNGAAGATREAMGTTLGVEGMPLEKVNEANAAWRLWLTNLPASNRPPAGPSSELGGKGQRDEAILPGPGVELHLANSIWVKEGVQVLPAFLSTNQKSYDAKVANLDFSKPEAAQAINQWVSDNTRSKIPTIIDGPIDPQSIMFLVNAVYFNGKWATPFDPKRTSPGQFTRQDGKAVTAPMMSRDGTFGMYSQEATAARPGFQAIRLPYGEGRMSMYVFLPDQGTDAGTFVKGLNEKDWNTWMGGFRESRAFVSMPKFKLEYEITLNDALKAMGMKVAFDPQQADFTGMVSRESLGGNNVYISRVKHKTFVEVTEEGTEAAGATGVEMGVTSMPPSFVVDRPFVTAIVDGETGTVLFMGLIADPSA